MDNKIYIIYKNDKFVGYTYDKDMLKQFKRTRKGKYKYIKFKTSKIPKNVLDNIDFDNYSLQYYVGYRLSTELPLFLYEFEKLEEKIKADLWDMMGSIELILDKLQYLKLDNFERKLIKAVFSELLKYIENIVTDHEIVFDEYIDIINYFNNIDLDD